MKANIYSHTVILIIADIKCIESDVGFTATKPRIAKSKTLYMSLHTFTVLSYKYYESVIHGEPLHCECQAFYVKIVPFQQVSINYALRDKTIGRMCNIKKVKGTWNRAWGIIFMCSCIFNDSGWEIWQAISYYLCMLLVCIPFPQVILI